MNIKLKIGSNILQKDNEQIEMDVAPFLQNDRTFVPVRFIAEAFGYTVGWDEELQLVTITDEKQSQHKKYFDTIEACAIDFAMCYQPMSIATNREISAAICKDENGFYYGNVYLGVVDAVAIQRKIPNVISDIHTHGSAGGYKAYDEFSSSDKNSAKRNKVEVSFMASPLGNVKEYNTTTGKTRIISYDTPYDLKEEVKCLKKYPNVTANKKFYKEYFGNVMPKVDAEDNKYTTQHLAWCNEADKHIKEYWNALI